MTGDSELLQRYVEEGADEAFAELVHRNMSLVYGAALRQVGGNTHMAEEVTQAVFIALACQANTLRHHAVLTGWLYTTTRFLALKTLRTQLRWQKREQRANLVNPPPNPPEPAWEELRPVIDDAMHQLGENDRLALLLRFFEGHSLAEVGATLGLAENTARMRVERALEKLRRQLARHGITSTAAALSTTLLAQPPVTPPPGLVANLAGASLAGATFTGGGVLSAGASALNFMTTAKLIFGTVGVMVAIGIGAFAGAHFRADPAPAPTVTRAETAEAVAITNQRAENRRLREELAQQRRAATLADRSTPQMASASTALDKLRVLAELKTRKVVAPGVAFVGGNGKITPAFAELFALAPEEQDALQGALDRARDKVVALERENATVEKAANGDVVITVQSFAEAGGMAYDELLKAFAQTLGPERQNAFLSLGAEQVEKAFDRFGLPQRTIVVSRNPNTASETHFIAQENHKLPNESGSSRSEFKTFEDLAKWVGPVANLIPGDLRGSK